MGMDDWRFRERHAYDVGTIGPNDGLTRNWDGTIKKYEGAKVIAALERMGHSTLTYETCKCRLFRKFVLDIEKETGLS